MLRPLLLQDLIGIEDMRNFGMIARCPRRADLADWPMHTRAGHHDPSLSVQTAIAKMRFLPFVSWNMK